jgi:glycosyltransferase involved in cell wall biosynthesis
MAESEFVPDPQHKNNPLTHVMPYLHKLFAKFGFDFLIFKSSNLAGFLPHLKYKSAIVPNGVNTDIFKPMNKIEARKKLNITSDLKIVLWIGDTTREVKGFHIATDVINLVKSKGIDLNFLYINKIPNEILPLYYNAADVFFLSSLSEGSPNVIKEAMACNCPIVTTLVGDVEYIIGNTKGCYIASDYDIESIAQLIINGLENVNRTNGSDRIDELKLDVKNIASKLISIYNKV